MLTIQNFSAQITPYIQKYKKNTLTLIVGVSGGADSMAILWLLHKLEKKMGYNLHVAHINHMLRGKESDKDETFVKNYCKKNNITCETHSFNMKKLAKTQKKGVEEMARIMRYTTFEKIRALHSPALIVTAHHASDQLETILFHFIRGSGPGGLRGIKTLENNIFRPLLAYTKEEILAFCRKNRIPFIEDATNTDPAYTRNFLRLRIIPELKKINPGIEKTVRESSKLFQEIETHFQEFSAQWLKKHLIPHEKGWKFSQEIFQKLSIAPQKSIIQNMLKTVSNTPYNTTQKNLDQFVTFINTSTSGQTRPYTKKLHFINQFGHIHIAAQKSTFSKTPKKQLKIGEKTHFLNTIITLHFTKKTNFTKKNTVYIDADTLIMPLSVRTYQPGDTFHPLGSSGSKKLQDFFTDKKIPQQQRYQMPIITDAKKNIIAVGTLSINNANQITPVTKKILKIEVSILKKKG